MNSENSTATRIWVASLVGGPCYPDEKCVTSAWSVVASVHVGLPMEGVRTPTSCAQDSRARRVTVTSVDVCKGSFHIYRTVGKLRASEGLLKLDHAAYGRLAS